MLRLSIIGILSVSVFDCVASAFEQAFPPANDRVGDSGVDTSLRDMSARSLVTGELASFSGVDRENIKEQLNSLGEYLEAHVVRNMLAFPICEDLNWSLIRENVNSMMITITRNLSEQEVESISSRQGDAIHPGFVEFSTGAKNVVTVLYNEPLQNGDKWMQGYQILQLENELRQLLPESLKNYGLTARKFAVVDRVVRFVQGEIGGRLPELDSMPFEEFLSNLWNRMQDANIEDRGEVIGLLDRITLVLEAELFGFQYQIRSKNIRVLRDFLAPQWREFQRNLMDSFVSSINAHLPVYLQKMFQALEPEPNGDVPMGNQDADPGSLTASTSPALLSKRPRAAKATKSNGTRLPDMVPTKKIKSTLKL